MRKHLIIVVLTLFSLPMFAQNIPVYVPKDGLVGWWPFNGNAIDESGNGLQGKPVEAVLTSDRAGKTNSAYHFYGTQSSMEVSNSATLDLFSKDFTLSMWVKRDKLPEGNYAESLLSKGKNSLVLAYSIGQNGIANPENNAFGFDSYGKNSEIYKGIVPINTWCHVVCIKSANQVIYYVNNKKFVTGLNDFNYPMSDVSNALCFGKKLSTNNQFFKGDLDDISIFTRALTDAEVSQLYNQTPAIILPAALPKNGLMAWYPFNGNANDESGNGHHCNVYGPTLTPDRFGVENKAYLFQYDSLQSYIKNLFTNNTSVTISGWFKSNVKTDINGYPDWSGQSFIPYAGVCSFGTNASFMDISIYGKGNLNIYTNDAQKYYPLALQNQSYHKNSWYHFAITYNGDSVKPYINGNLSSISKSGVKFNKVDSIFTIGKAFMGTLDDISVHNRVLSNSEIMGLYTSISDSLPCTPPTVSFFVEGKSVLCAGESTNLVATSNVNYMYQWYKNDTLMAGVSTNFITTKESGTYHLKVSNGSCDYITPKLTILVKALPKATLDIKGKTSYCSGETINTTLTVNAGYAKYSYKWNSTQTSASINATKAMKYTVVVSDSANCTLQLSVDIKSLPLPSIGFEGPVGTVFKNDAPIKLYTSPSGGTFQGEQIVGDMYYPVNDRVGKRRIAYSVTSPEGCANTVLRAFYLVDTLNTNCTKITYDTTYVTKYDTVSVKKTVYDTVIFTNNIIKYDTVKVTKFDTITVKNNLYDTVTITNNVTKYDTVLVNKYDTLKVTKFDTITIKNNVYDTVTITNNVTKYDTVKVTKFDTVTVKNNVYDTVIVNTYDTITVTNKVTKYDTVNVTKFDTITIKNNVYDTVTITNNVTKYDTVKVTKYDTITFTNNVTKYDTILVNKYDTITVTNNVTKYDTITLTDTVSILKITFKLTTGIQANQMASMSLYPNPTTDVLHIEVGDAKALDGYRYRILDALGKEVYNELVKNAITEIPLKSLGAAGMYQFEVLDQKNVRIQANKIVLQ